MVEIHVTDYLATDESDKPDALTDTATAVAAIEEERVRRSENGEKRASPVIAPSICGDVEAALASRHPRQFARPGFHIMAHTIVKSPLRHAARPEVPESLAASLPATRVDADEVAQRAADAAARAAERLARMRGL